MKLPETIRAAFVIARRDFVATVFSKTFLLFLLGPLFPIGLGFIFGGIGAQVSRTASPPAIAVVSSPADFRLLEAARTRLLPLEDDRPLVQLHHPILGGIGHVGVYGAVPDRGQRRPELSVGSAP